MAEVKTGNYTRPRPPHEASAQALTALTARMFEIDDIIWYPLVSGANSGIQFRDANRYRAIWLRDATIGPLSVQQLDRALPSRPFRGTPCSSGSDASDAAERIGLHPASCWRRSLWSPIRKRLPGRTSLELRPKGRQPRSRPTFVVKCAPAGKEGILGFAVVSYEPIAWTPRPLVVAGAWPLRPLSRRDRPRAENAGSCRR